MKRVALRHTPSVPESSGSTGATKRENVRARVRHPGAVQRVGGRHDLIARERTAEQMSLPDVAAGGAKARQMGRRLHALRDDLEAETMRQLDRRGHDGSVALIGLHARHERGVDLEYFRGEGLRCGPSEE